MKRLAPAVLAALALAAPAAAATKPKPSSPASTTACRNRIVNEWEGTGVIRTTFPPACYRAALTYLNGRPDLQEYSSLGDDIRLALRASLQRHSGNAKVPLVVGKRRKTSTDVGFTTTTTGGHLTIVPTKTPPKGPHSGSGSGSGSTAVALTNTAASSSGSGLPLPVIILGGIAIALIAAGAIGAGVRARRGRP